MTRFFGEQHSKGGQGKSISELRSEYKKTASMEEIVQANAGKRGRVIPGSL